MRADDVSLTFPPASHAVGLLLQEHEVLRRLILAFGRVRNDAAQSGREEGIVGRLCLGLTLHERTEDEVIGPALASRPESAPLLHQMATGHARVRTLIARLDELEPGDAGHHAAVSALAACVAAHFADEEATLFPLLRGVDTAVLAGTIIAHQRQWRAEAAHLTPHRSGESEATWPATCHVVDGWSPPDAPMSDPPGSEVPNGPGRGTGHTP